MISLVIWCCRIRSTATAVDAAVDPAVVVAEKAIDPMVDLVKLLDTQIFVLPECLGDYIITKGSGNPVISFTVTN